MLSPIVDGSRRCPIKMGSDNPDNLYEAATIDGRFTYRLHGRRGTVNYLGLGVQAGQYGAPGGLKTVDYVELANNGVGDSGTVDVYIGPQSAKMASQFKGKQWLHSVEDPTSGLIIVRQTFLDRDNEIPAKVLNSSYPRSLNSACMAGSPCCMKQRRDYWPH